MTEKFVQTYFADFINGLTPDEKRQFEHDLVLPIFANKREKLEEHMFLQRYTMEEF